MIVDAARVEWKWIDRITDVQADGLQLTAFRTVLPTEWYFAHHFERFPVVPGVFLIEMMAHAPAYLQVLRVREESSEWAHYFLAGVDGTRFYHHVSPGSRIDLAADFRQGDEQQALLAATARVDGRRVARTELFLQRIEGDWLVEQDKYLEEAIRRVLGDELKSRYDLR